MIPFSHENHKVFYLESLELYGIKVGMVDIDVHISSHLKEELAWTVDKQLWLIVLYIMLFKKSKELKGTKFKTILYTLLCGL